MGRELKFADCVSGHRRAAKDTVGDERPRGTTDISIQSPVSPTAVIEPRSRMAHPSLQQSLPPEHRAAAHGRDNLFAMIADSGH